MKKEPGPPGGAWGGRDRSEGGPGKEGTARGGGESAGRRGEHGKEGTVRCEEGRARRGWESAARKGECGEEGKARRG